MSGLVHVDEGGLESRMRDATRTRAPALVVGAIAARGQRVVRATGHAAPGIPAREDTPFPWFSATKLFTATATMRLVERGAIELDAPVSAYLPSVTLEREGRHATVRDLLSHTAGLANPIPIRWAHLAGERGPGLDALSERVVGARPALRSVPGARFAYSNLGYLLLGQIVERATGQPFEEHVAEQVLQPLGCGASGFELPAGAAIGHQRRLSVMGLVARAMLGARFFEPEPAGPYWALRPFLVDGAPYGGLVGPVGDLLRLAQMMLAEGTIEGRRVLAPESVRALLTPARDLAGRALPMGLGWHLGREGEAEYAGHIGGGGGFRAELRVYPSLGYAIALVGSETSFPTGDFARLHVGA